MLDKSSHYYSNSCIELKDLEVDKTYYVINGDWRFTVVSKSELSFTMFFTDVDVFKEPHTVPYDSILFVLLG